jgi:hypothetical protein
MPWYVRILKNRKLWMSLLALGTLASLLSVYLPARAFAPANDAFQRTWARTDQPVQSGQATRTWMWGPEAFTNALTEPYADSPGGHRTVQYFDKSRMEITDPNGNQSSEWYVTNGLLVMELVTGRLQLGNDDFQQYAAAEVSVAGDAGATNSPTYATIGHVLDVTAGMAQREIRAVLRRDGSIDVEDHFASFGVGTTHFVNETNHWIADPFWEFMNSEGVVYQDGAFEQARLFSNPYFATGYPIIDPYWSWVTVGGVDKPVLIQCFERRCLTYTPDNAPEWRVESGNVGQHYYHWRYAVIPGVGDAPCPDGLPAEVYVYVADQNNDRVQKFDADGDYICQFGGERASGSFIEPYAVEVGPNGNVYVLGLGEISWFDPRGRFQGSVGDGTLGGFDFAVTSDSHVIIYNWFTFHMEEYDLSGDVVNDWDVSFGPGHLESPYGIAVDGQDNVYVTDYLVGRIVKFDANGNFVTGWASQGPSGQQFDAPTGITVDEDTRVYVVDGSWVEQFDTDGNSLARWNNGIQGGWAGQQGIAVTSSGDIYVADAGADMVRQYSNGGEPIGSWGGSGSGPGQFDQPLNVAIGYE